MHIQEIARRMVAYNAGDARRIHHFIKVYGFAKMIGETEGLDADTQEILEIAALTHDIGIRNSERKYGNCSGAHQQEEGPPEARCWGGRSVKFGSCRWALYLTRGTGINNFMGLQKQRWRFVLTTSL